MAKKKNGVIGFDPLAWMKDPGPESGTMSPEPKAQERLPAEPAPAMQKPAAGAADVPRVVALGDTLTIEQAAAMHTELVQHLDTTSVVLEAGALQRIDAAGLQLLTAFVRAADGRGARVEWRAPSAVLRDGARRLGLAVALHLS